LLLGCILALVVLEGGLRVAVRVLRSRSAGLESGRDGDREAEIWCIGDSFTQGAGVEDPGRDSYPARLQELLAVRLGPGYRVLNHGHSGENAAQVANRFQALLGRGRPLAVLVTAGANNFWNFAESSIFAEGEGRVERWFDRLRVLRLFRLLAVRLTGGGRYERLTREERLRQGWSALQQGDLEVAQERFEAILRSEPDVAWARLGLAEALRWRGRPAAAIRECERAEELGLPRRITRFGIAGCYRRLGEWARAQQEYRAAIEGPADRYHVEIELAWLDLARGEVAAGEAYFERLTRSGNRSTEILEGLAWAMLCRRDFEGAAAVFREACNQDPPMWSAPAGIGMAVTAMAGGDLSRAASLLEPLLPRFELRPYVHVYLGWVRAAQNRREEARALLSEALTHSPGFPSAMRLRRRLDAEPFHAPDLFDSWAEWFVVPLLDSRPGGWFLQRSEPRVLRSIRLDLQRIVDLARAHRTALFLQTYPAEGMFGAANPTIRDLAEELSVPLIDQEAYQRAWLAEHPGVTLHVRDGHCNARGYALMAEAAVDVLADHLPRKPGAVSREEPHAARGGR
jgi:tetratricopeptide (TPR) repeat protein